MALLGNPSTSRRFDPVEFFFVLAIAFGDAILGSLLKLVSGSVGTDFVQHGDMKADHMANLIGYELAVLPMIALVLIRGGWRLADFGGRPGWRDVHAGILLWLAGVATLGIVHVLAQWIFGADNEALKQLADPRADGAASGWLVAAAFLVNPLFEELLVTVYVIEALKRRFSTNTAIHVSALLRMAYHLYQGPYAIVWYGVYGLLAAHAYMRWRSLWPLVIAHILHDLVALVLLGARAA